MEKAPKKTIDIFIMEYQDRYKITVLDKQTVLDISVTPLESNFASLIYYLRDKERELSEYSFDLHLSIGKETEFKKLYYGEK